MLSTWAESSAQPGTNGPAPEAEADRWPAKGGYRADLFLLADTFKHGQVFDFCRRWMERRHRPNWAAPSRLSFTRPESGGPGTLRVRSDRGEYVEQAVRESVQLVAEGALIDPLWADTILVSLGLFPSGGRLGHFDGQGRFLRSVGDAPASAESVPAEVLQHAYQSTLAGDAARARFAVATRHAHLFEVLNPDGTVIARAEPPFGFLPRFGVGERGGRATRTTGPDLRFGYIDLAVTEEHVYALFSGRTRRGFPGRANQGEYVHVYDWDARLLEVYQLDLPAVAIAVSLDGRELYVVRHQPLPAVVRYELGRHP